MYNIRPLDSAGGTRLPNRMVQSPLPTVSGDYFNDVEGRVPIGGGGSPKPPPGGSSGKSILCQDQFISRLFLVAKKDGSF